MAIFAFICAKTTADFVVPAVSSDVADLARRVSNFAKGLVGGTLTVGDIKLRTTQAAIPNHLLCDGSTISRSKFPQLVTYLAGETANTATLPNLSGGLTITAPTVTQTVTDSGTVATTETVVTDAGQVGGTTGGNVTTGGRLRPLEANEREP